MPSLTTVFVGTGSIGSALAVALVAAGCNKVVFFRRRPDSNSDLGTVAGPALNVRSSRRGISRSERTGSASGATTPMTPGPQERTLSVT